MCGNRHPCHPYLPGSRFEVTVTALDAYDHTASGYLGTVTFNTSDSDPGVVLPSDYTFTTDDQGVHIFAAGATLITVGDQTLTVTDKANSTLTGGVTVTVGPGQSAPPGGNAGRPSTSSINITPTESALPEQDLACVDQAFASTGKGKSELWNLVYRFKRDWPAASRRN